jgi:threonine-phosphate decarboxylase
MSPRCSHGGIYSVDNPKSVKSDFSSNINPLGISKKVIEAIQKNVCRLSSLYPDPKCMDLKKQLLNYLGIDLTLECISVGNGATEIIHNFARAFVNDSVVIPCPTFCEYEVASRRMRAHILFVPLKNFRLDAELVIERAKKQDAIFLCNPNNPTGLLSTYEIKKIVEEIEPSTKVLIDESFIEFVDSTHSRSSMVDKVKEFDNLVVLRSMTKSFGLAGLRLGYSISNPKLAERLLANTIHWNVNGIAQIAAVAALKDVKHLARGRAIIKKEREYMHSYMEKNMRSFKPMQSDANYFLIHLQNKDSLQARDSMLLRNGVLVRDCSNFRGMGRDYIRVAVRKHKENLLLLDAMESAD